MFFHIYKSTHTSEPCQATANSTADADDDDSLFFSVFVASKNENKIRLNTEFEMKNACTHDLYKRHTQMKNVVHILRAHTLEKCPNKK